MIAFTLPVLLIHSPGIYRILRTMHYLTGSVWMGIVPVCMVSGMPEPTTYSPKAPPRSDRAQGKWNAWACSETCREWGAWRRGLCNIPRCLRVVTVVTVHGVRCVRVGVRCVKSQPSVYPWRTLVMTNSELLRRIPLLRLGAGLRNHTHTAYQAVQNVVLFNLTEVLITLGSQKP